MNHYKAFQPRTTQRFLNSRARSWHARNGTLPDGLESRRKLGTIRLPNAAETLPSTPKSGCSHSALFQFSFTLRRICWCFLPLTALRLSHVVPRLVETPSARLASGKNPARLCLNLNTHWNCEAFCSFCWVWVGVHFVHGLGNLKFEDILQYRKTKHILKN